MPSDSASGAQPALARERVQPARQRDRAQRRRVGPAQPRARERLAQHAAVERRAVGDEHAPAQLLGELGQHRLGRRRLVDHRLRDAGEALDARATAARARARSVSQRSCSSPPPTSTAPTSVSSQRVAAPGRSSRCRRRGTPWWRRADRDPSGPCSIRLAPDGTQRTCVRMPPERVGTLGAHPVWKEAAHDDFSHPTGDRAHHRASARRGRPTARACASSRAPTTTTPRPTRGTVCRERCAS